MQMMFGDIGERARGHCCLHVAGRLSVVVLASFQLLVAAVGCADAPTSDSDEPEVPSRVIEMLYDAIVEDDAERVVQAIQEYELPLDSAELFSFGETHCFDVTIGLCAVRLGSVDVAKALSRFGDGVFDCCGAITGSCV